MNFSTPQSLLESNECGDSDGNDLETAQQSNPILFYLLNNPLADNSVIFDSYSDAISPCSSVFEKRMNDDNPKTDSSSVDEYLKILQEEIENESFAPSNPIDDELSGNSFGANTFMIYLQKLFESNNNANSEINSVLLSYSQLGSLPILDALKNLINCGNGRTPKDLGIQVSHFLEELSMKISKVSEFESCAENSSIKASSTHAKRLCSEGMSFAELLNDEDFEHEKLSRLCKKLFTVNHDQIFKKICFTQEDRKIKTFCNGSSGKNRKTLENTNSVKDGTDGIKTKVSSYLYYSLIVLANCNVIVCVHMYIDRFLHHFWLYM